LKKQKKLKSKLINIDTIIGLYLGNSWDGTQLSKAVVLRFLNTAISKILFLL